MINYISLPNFYNNYTINNKLITLFYTRRNWFKEFSFRFENQRGNFPYLSWSKGSLIQAPMAMYEDIVLCNEKNGTGITIDCSNIYLTKNDYLDTYGNLILKHNENGSNNIEISDLSFMQYLAEKYPLYNFLFSKEAYFLNPNVYTPKVINAITEKENITGILIPDHLLENLNFLNEIHKKNKIWINLTPKKCCLACDQYEQCNQIRHEQQINYSNNNIFIDCSKVFVEEQITKNINYSIIEDYNKLGINHFYFDDFSTNELDIIKFYIRFFLKEEYFEEALLYFINK